MEKNTQLPVEVETQITKEAEAHNTRLKEHAESEKDEAYAQGFAEGWGEGATAYAPWKVKYEELCERFKAQDQAMFALQQELSQLKAQPAPRWVKASERLPEKDGYYCFKANGGYMGAYLRTASNGSRWFCDSAGGTIRNWKNCEWLDEQPAAGREEDAVAFAEWLDKERNERTNNYKNISICGKETAYKIMYDIFKKEGAE